MNFTRLPKAVPGLLPVAALAAKPFLRGSSSFFNSYSHPMCCLLGLRQKHALVGPMRVQNVFSVLPLYPPTYYGLS
jgi:hypothetical protein